MRSKTFKNVEFFERVCTGDVLVYDEACLEINGDRGVSLWRQYTKCDGCEEKMVARIDSGGGSAAAVLKTIYPVRYSVRDAADRQLCNGTYSFGEYGKYRLNVTEGVCGEIVTTDQPDEPLFPFLVALVILLSAATVWYVVKALYRRVGRCQLWNRFVAGSDFDSELLVGSPAANNRTNTRLRSLDVFRGITVALMIFINYGGGGYAMMKHTPWNGMTIADIVFPWFAWLMGFSLCLSLHTRLRTSMKRRTAFYQILRRSAILISIGIILSSEEFTIEELRLPGVLQRLGLAYLLAGTLECFFIDASNNYGSGFTLFRDMRATFWQWSGTMVYVGAHTLLTFLLQVPGCPTGYLGPGGLHNHSANANCTGGAAAYIDIKVFGESHLYHRGSFRQLYGSKSPFDPEGLLGTLTCALVVQLGAQAARVLLAFSHSRVRLTRWLLWGFITGIIAGGLCTFSENNGPIPINKNLWSLSFALATSSMAFVFLAFLYVIIDLYPLWQGRPFYYAGRNALLLYVGHDLMKGRFPFEWKLHNPSHMELLAMNSFAVLLWLAIAIFLHRKNVILAI